MNNKTLKVATLGRTGKLNRFSFVDAYRVIDGRDQESKLNFGAQ